MNGDFSFPTTNTLFSRIALDQLHKHNNKFIKATSGETSVINKKDESALNCWVLGGRASRDYFPVWKWISTKWSIITINKRSPWMQ